MRILSMRASFGKLEHETLTLTPGLNVVEAPNEWGKSTWCAFLVAMLYGIDTRSKTTRNQLADKERYAPWTGSPMEGSMELIWNNRTITIERSTKGRIPMGEFRAYETDSGLDIPELTAENCGQMLLGVEKDVFTRAGFLRFSDLPVTDNEQLRSRLNALVTTGDESGSGQLLDQKLRELKNRCRYNRSGLLPQAQLQRDLLQSSIREHQSLTQQEEKFSKRAQELEEYIAKLNNHKAALRYQGAQMGDVQIKDAQEAVDQAAAELKELEEQCASLPSREEAFRNVQQLTQLRQGMDAIQMEEQMMPMFPSVPEPPVGFEGCTAKSAILQAETHRDELRTLRPKKSLLTPILVGLSTALLMYAAFLFFWGKPLWSMGVAAGGLLYLLFSFITIANKKRRVSQYRSRQITLFRRYGNSDPEQWVADAHDYARAWADYTRREDACTRLRGDLDTRKESMINQSMEASNSKGISASLKYWTEIMDLWDACADARRQLGQKEKHLQAVSSIATTALPPDMDDDLTFTEAETNRLLADANHELRQVLSKLGQYQGQVEALGNRSELEQQHQQMDSKIHKLEQTYQALEYAQKALTEATAQLQRRFAPRITESTQALFSRLTNGRYDRLQIAQDFSLHIGARNEDILRSHRWRSDGTVDQLYLALRLAVARELTPESPIILDDALVRFDNSRLKTALELLEQESDDRQVILFTCQNRERKILQQVRQ